MSPRTAQRSAIALALIGVVSAALTALAPAASAVVPTAPVKLPSAIELLPPYQPQSFCDPIAKPGTKALANLLTATYKNTSIVDLTRPCGTDVSEHYDGRAIDWGVSVFNSTQKAQGQAFLKWLFATDGHGNSYANVRRLGVMYVIWNKRIWGAWSQSWAPYTCSGVTACHQDHMHISLDWSGAMQKTSFWTGVVSTPMNPPNFVYRSAAYAQTVRVRSRSAHVTPPFRVKGGLTYRFTVSGTYHYDGKTAHRADASCSTTNGTTWSATAPSDTSASVGNLDLWVNGKHGWTPSSTTGSSCNSSTHAYSRTITFPSTTSLTLAVKDATHGDDSGALTVVVQRVS